MIINQQNYDRYGVGHNFRDPIYPQDIEYIVYGDDAEEIVTRENPERPDGQTPWFKEPSYDRWWKVGIRSNTEG